MGSSGLPHRIWFHIASINCSSAMGVHLLQTINESSCLPHVHKIEKVSPAAGIVIQAVPDNVSYKRHGFEVANIASIEMEFFELRQALFEYI